MSVVAVAVLGLVAGAFLPKVIAIIPDREAAPDESPRTPHRVLAAAPRLGLGLAVVTATVWAGLAASRGMVADLPAYLLVGGLGVAMAYVDVREHRLPDWLTYSAFAAAAVLLAAAALADDGWGSYGRAWLGALALAGAFLGLLLARPADLGLGDVKLAGSLGLLLGWIGWGHVVLGGFLSFAFGGLFSIGLLLARRAGRRSHIPFGPFMLAGALAAVVWGTPLLDAYLGR